jgi:hypothetical protein
MGVISPMDGPKAGAGPCSADRSSLLQQTVPPCEERPFRITEEASPHFAPQKRNTPDIPG